MKTLRYFLLFIILQLSFYISSSAQMVVQPHYQPGSVSYSAFQDQQIDTDTLYYPFYKGIQMIEIREANYVENQKKTVEMNRSFPTIYMFRNEYGEIISKFNLMGREIIYSALKSVEEGKSESVVHKPEKLDTQRKFRQYALRDMKGIYAVYNCPDPKSDRQGSSVNHFKDIPCFIGLIDSMGQMIIEPVCESISIYKDSYMVTGYPNGSETKKIGLLGKDLKWEIPFEYDYLEQADSYKKIYKARKEGKSYLLKENGEVIISSDYDEMTEYYYKKDWYNVKKDGKFGLINDKMELVVPCEYSKTIGEFKEGFTIAAKETGYGVLNEKGEEISEFKYTISCFKDKNYFKGRDHQKYYIMDINGKELCSSQYEFIQSIDDKRFIVRRGNAWEGGKCAIIGRDENILLPFDYFDIHHIRDDIFTAGIKGKEGWSYMYENSEWIVMNSAGEKLIRKEFKNINPLNDELFIGDFKEKKGIFDWEGEEIAGCEYDEITPFGKDLLKVRKDNKYFFIYYDGKKSDRYEYDEHSFLGGGLYRVRIGKEYSIVDSSGKNLLPYSEKIPEYRTSNGWYAFKQKNKWKLFKNYGEPFMENEWEAIDLLQDHVIIGKMDNNTGAMNFDGKTLIPFVYDAISPITGEYYTVKKGEFVGLYHLTQGEIVPCSYDYLDMKNGWIFVKKDNRYFPLNIDGKELDMGDYDWVNFLYEYSTPDCNAFVARKEGKIGVITKDNEILLPFIFDYHQTGFDNFLSNYLKFTEEYVTVFQRTRKDSVERWFVNREGELVNRDAYENRTKGFTIIHSSENDYRLYKYGFVNWYGETIVPYKYKRIENLENNHFVYRIDSLMGLDGEGEKSRKEYVKPKYGLLDTTGKVIIPAKYDEIKWHENKYIKVKDEGLWGLYDSLGNLLCNPIYNGFGFDIPGIITFGYGGTSNQGGNGNRYEGGKVGVMDMNGMVWVQAKYDYIWRINQETDLLVVSRDNAMGIIDRRGGLIGEFISKETPAQRWKRYMETGK